jgi:hypothetical protein
MTVVLVLKNPMALSHLDFTMLIMHKIALVKSITFDSLRKIANTTGKAPILTDCFSKQHLSLETKER